jgi:hypothetical protein
MRDPFVDHIRALLLRELRAVRREIEAYPDDIKPWTAVPGMPNSGGNLALHVCGNLRHFVGAGIGRSGYIRKRDLEFTSKGLSRAEIVAIIDAASVEVTQGLDALTEETLGAPYPEPVGNRVLDVRLFLMHLGVHLGYHLGQIDYHRRAVAGDTASTGNVSLAEIGEPVTS